MHYMQMAMKSQFHSLGWGVKYPKTDLYHWLLEQFIAVLSNLEMLLTLCVLLLLVGVGGLGRPGSGAYAI